MLEVKTYTPRDRRLDVGLIVLGAAALGGLVWLASDSGDELEAEHFDELWELMSPNALALATQRGLVYPHEVQAVIDGGRVPNIEAAIRLLKLAPSVIDDNERDTLAACLRPTYPELLLFSAMFTLDDYIAAPGLSPGAWILSYMDPESNSDARTLAMIARHIKALRATHAHARRA